jgi:acyl-CoA synthetase (AMP-forming)/AMP-acid ligase II
MIISGGQNIYPADIEAVMVQHPALAEVAVIGVADSAWGETPLAVVVLRPGFEGSDALEIASWTNARVGKRQRISRVVFRQDLPRNPNGKVLKRVLRTQYDPPQE